MSTSAKFNTQEVQGYIARGWLDALDKLDNPKLTEKDKPQVHTGSAKGSNGASRWSINKSSAMANQKDLLEELRRQIKS